MGLMDTIRVGKPIKGEHIIKGTISYVPPDNFLVWDGCGYISCQPHEERRKVTTCKNCGAPVHGNHCEYCDTEY